MRLGRALRAVADRLDPPAERRALGDNVAELFGVHPLASGMAVNARSAEGLSTVLSCVAAISSAIASLPALIYRRDGEGRREDTTHPLNRLIRQGPNQYQSWADFIEWTMASTLLRGNGLAEITTDARGAVTGLMPVPWPNVSVQLLPSGRLAYDVVAVNGLYGGTGRTRRLLADEVLHLRDRSDDGLIGRSRLSRAAETIGNALATQEFSGSMYRNGANPSGAVEIDGKFSDASYARFKENFRQEFTGPSNAAKVLILENGAKWKSITISPEDAELLASRRFTTEELARIYQVPPPLVGIWQFSSFTNSETASRWFSQFTLGPWITKIEAEFQRSIFSTASPSTLTLDLSGFLRGDPESRWRSHEIAVKNRILTRNEVREVEGYNAMPGGDAWPEESASAQA